MSKVVDDFVAKLQELMPDDLRESARETYKDEMKKWGPGIKRLLKKLDMPLIPELVELGDAMKDTYLLFYTEDGHRELMPPATMDSSRQDTLENLADQAEEEDDFADWKFLPIFHHTNGDLDALDFDQYDPKTGKCPVVYLNFYEPYPETIAPSLPDYLRKMTREMISDEDDENDEKPRQTSSSLEAEVIDALARFKPEEVGFDKAGHVDELVFERPPKGTPQLTDENLAEVGKLTKLAIFITYRPDLSDAGLQHLARLTKLEVLALGGLGITDDGLAHFAKLTRLREFLLDAPTNVTGSGLAHLRKCQDIDRMELSECPLTDSGLAQLAVFESLTNLELVLTRANVTFEGLLQLQKIPSLELLKIRGWKATRAKKRSHEEQLQDSMPDCEVALF